MGVNHTEKAPRRKRGNAGLGGAFADSAAAKIALTPRMSE